MKHPNLVQETAQGYAQQPAMAVVRGHVKVAPEAAMELAKILVLADVQDIVLVAVVKVVPQSA